MWTCDPHTSAVSVLRASNDRDASLWGLFARVRKFYSHFEAPQGVSEMSEDRTLPWRSVLWAHLLEWTQIFWFSLFFSPTHIRCSNFSNVCIVYVVNMFTRPVRIITKNGRTIYKPQNKQYICIPTYVFYNTDDVKCISIWHVKRSVQFINAPFHYEMKIIAFLKGAVCCVWRGVSGIILKFIQNLRFAGMRGGCWSFCQRTLMTQFWRNFLWMKVSNVYWWSWDFWFANLKFFSHSLCLFFSPWIYVYSIHRFWSSQHFLTLIIFVLRRIFICQRN